MNFNRRLVFAIACLCIAGTGLCTAEETEPPKIRVGMIGLDTSHCIAFTRALNDPNAGPELAGCTVVAAYPKGSPDIVSSTKRVPNYTAQMKGFGVEIVDSIDELLKRVDAVLLETNDGRPHLEQVMPVFKAGKPVFIDKPVAGSLSDAIKIYAESKRLGVPVFSASSLRFSKDVQAVASGAVGNVIGCDAYSPCVLEKTHPDLFWYGIHGVETLLTVMGPGCKSVTRIKTDGTDVVVGHWDDGRIGSFRGIRDGKADLGGTAFGDKGIQPFKRTDHYEALLSEIVKFFRTGEPPVTAEETLEIYAFMEAADESHRRGGESVKLDDVMAKAAK